MKMTLRDEWTGSRPERKRCKCQARLVYKHLEEQARKTVGPGWEWFSPEQNLGSGMCVRKFHVPGTDGSSPTWLHTCHAVELVEGYSVDSQCSGRLEFWEIRASGSFPALILLATNILWGTPCTCK
jgi:hypothetical protein